MLLHISGAGRILAEVVQPLRPSQGQCVDASIFNPGRVAFLVLREIYAWFGHPEEAIPYTSGTGDDKAIDITTISAIT
jgi:hypothetical protein